MHHWIPILSFVLLSSMQAIGLAQPPNVLVILTDDQGWGDLSCHGNTNLSTPHLDSLAREGASAQNFYVCQVCAPTRAEFLTGRYYPRTGVSGVSRGEGRLNADEVTIADRFHDAGYATGAFGKWHNGTQSPLHPNDRGFDEFYGFTSGHWGHYFSPPLDHNGKRVKGDGFIVDDLTNHAIDFIRDHHTKPFFCYLPLNTPHSPMMIDDGFYKKFADAEFDMKHREPEREDIAMTRAALAMCENIDWNVGRVLKTLDDLRLAENTIVVFFCDNGPNSYRWNGGMKGRKGSIDEGGLRSPLFVRWPKKIKPKTRLTTVLGGIDLLPTLCQMAGIDPGRGKPLDGRSFADLLQDPNSEWPKRMLFAYHPKKGVSVRTQRFRLDASGKLYNIEMDRAQRKDVTGTNTATTKRLVAAAALHAKEMNGLVKDFSGRPFHVGFRDLTTLPARDGVPHGDVQRSSKAPNNSFFENWTSEDGYVTWEVDVANEGDYEAIVWHTCRQQDVGVTIHLQAADAETSAQVKTPFDPPLWDKSKERVEKSHYFVKDFRPLKLGVLHLKAGKQTLRLSASELKGSEAIDVQAIDLVRDP